RWHHRGPISRSPPPSFSPQRPWAGAAHPHAMKVVEPSPHRHRGQSTRGGTFPATARPVLVRRDHESASRRCIAPPRHRGHSTRGGTFPATAVPVHFGGDHSSASRRYGPPASRVSFVRSSSN